MCYPYVFALRESFQDFSFFHFFMARGDYRKRNIKADFIQTKSKNGLQQKKEKTIVKTKKKDPGVPDLQKLGQKLSKHIKKEQVQKKELTEEEQLREFTQRAASRSHVFNSSIVELNHFEGQTQDDAAAVGKKDNSRKAYYREFKKVVDQADVILEILDARDPLGCRTLEVEEMIMNAGSGKKIILILNKIDLVPRETVQDWLKHLRNEFPCIAFKASTQSQRTNLGQSNVKTTQANDSLLNASECLGADNLVKLLKNYCRNINLKTSITVGVVGYPNVGKSSVINSLKRSKVCGVGSTPGVTKVAQLIHLDKNINLLDCPGIVFSQTSDSSTNLLKNCVKVELLDDPISPIDVILTKCSVDCMQQIYEIDRFETTNQFLVLVAMKRGKLLKGGIPDIESAARSIIQDWNQGRIPFYTIPPKSGISKGVHVSSELVTTWAKEFSLDTVDDDDVLNDALMEGGTIPMMDQEYSDEEAIEMETETFENAEVTDMAIDYDGEPAASQIRFKDVIKKTKSYDMKPVVNDSIENFQQRNQEMKKMSKKNKKEQRRLSRMASNNSLEMDMDE
jgi:nuclear GTP-binding protein